MEKGNPVFVGKAIRIRGKLRGAEDFILGGLFEGSITLAQNQLTIEPGARMVGDVDVRAVTAQGEHAGNTRATEKVHLDSTARVLGNVKAPRLVIEDGAKFKGTVDMEVAFPPDLKLKFKK